MKKWIAFWVVLSFSHFATANEIIVPITNLFDAMRSHDADKLKAQFTDAAKLQRAMKDGTVKENSIAKFAQNIATSTALLEEHLLKITVVQSDNLASVWTPYAFYLDGKLSHCGVNSFQLINTDVGWKIHYLIDNSHSGDCHLFIKQFDSQQ